jgi:CHAT domain-containing protein/Tfp pilus assembly protein PilF
VSGPAGTELAEAARLLGTGDRRGARAAYERALALAEQAGDRAGMAAAWSGIGDSSNLWSDDRGLQCYQKSLELAEGRPKELARARVLLATGVGDFKRGDIALAMDRYQQARAQAEIWGDLPLLARAFHAIGNAASQQGDYSQAERSYTAGLRLVEKTENRRAIAYALQSLGDVAAGRGDNALALEHFEKALAIARPLGDRDVIAGLLNAIGNVHLARSDAARAYTYFQEVLALEPEDKSEIGYTLNNLGIILSFQGEGELGLDYFLKSLAVLEKIEGEKAGAARSLNNLGLIYKGRGEYERSLDYFTRALRNSEEVGDASAMPGHWNGVGSVWEIQGNNANAREAYRKSLELAEGLGDQAGMAEALLGLARLDRAENQYPSALELADRAAAIAAESGNREDFWEARTVGGEALRGLGQGRLAREAFEQAILTIEQMRGQLSGSELGRQGFLALRLQPYAAMIDLLVQEGDLPGALAYAESAKGRVLLEILDSRRTDARQEITDEELAGERRLADQLAELNQQVFLARWRKTGEPSRLQDLEERLRRARLEREAFRADLDAAHPRLRAQPVDIRSLTPASFSSLLPDRETALIEYVVLEDKTYLLTLTPAAADSPPILHLHSIAIRREDLGKAVEDFRERLGQRNLDFESQARNLYDLLLGPARAELEGKRRLYIVPDGALWNLPFQAVKPSTTEYLLERHAISYSPSLRLLRDVTKEADRRRRAAPPRRQAPGPLLAVGDPTLAAEAIQQAGPLRSRQHLAPLPEAAWEVRSLAALYGPGNSRIYLGAEASERVFKAEAGNFRLLHLATHGILDDRNPMYSSLVLSQTGQSQGEDGLLEAWELLELKLDADLVVLSACQTAQGRLGAGEGVIGLSWALFAAGSRAIVASQWEVDSASSSQIMVELHRGLLAGHSKSEALRLAALKLQKQDRYRHPFYWAGFVLLGDGS